jgi:mono/diheme cytochrome c family protein
MPNWGLHIKYKDIDAVAAYIGEAMSAAETVEAAQ